MKPLRWSVFVLALCHWAWGQGSIATGVPVVVNSLGQPQPQVTVAITSTNPCGTSPAYLNCGGLPSGTYTGTTPPSSLVTSYQDISLGTPCVGSPLGPLNGPTCSNPGVTDGQGNVVVYAVSGGYWCTVYGANVTSQVQPCIFPAPVTGSGLLATNNTWTGTNTFSNTVTLGTVHGNATFSGNLTLSGSNLFTGVNSFNVNSGSVTLANATGNAALNLSATSGINTATGGLFAVPTNAHNGEMQWQIFDTNPFGWRFCATNGLTLCPLLIDGGSGLSGTSGITLTNAVNDISIVMSATDGGTVSSQTLDSVASNGRAGEFEFRMNSATPDAAAAWEFVNTNGTIVPASINVNAPNHSLLVNADGTITVPSAIKTGTSSNTDQAGTCVLGTSCNPAVTFSATYAVAPICVGTDQTAAAAVKAVVTTTTLVLTGTGTDTLDYVCVPRH